MCRQRNGLSIAMDREPWDRHWIRLRGPWEVAWLEGASYGPPTTAKLPAPWIALFGPRAGTARFIRRFQAPARLDPDERVCVTLCGVGGEVAFWINNIPLTPLKTPLGEPDCWPHERCLSFDITALLRRSNRLTLEITVRDPAAPDSGLHQAVLLEIVTLDDDPPIG
jgi:hypothetical protein